ncbi:hypothetical protein F5884DRAFT_514790 [Xylogone sp. PMI_703]|nr:hypothetical protein F5884DRAFT_514790 [Xylogone sp. PMI_703]
MLWSDWLVKDLNLLCRVQIGNIGYPCSRILLVISQLHPKITIDFIPPWELQQKDGKWYHIDDVQELHPVSFNLPSIEDSVHLRVPYSFTPSLGLESDVLPTGLTDWQRLRQCLGNLYSVPSDRIFALPFERHELRITRTSGNLDTYLTRIEALFKKLYKNGGSFRIIDFRRDMDSHFYYWGLPSKSSRDG